MGIGYAIANQGYRDVVDLWEKSDNVYKGAEAVKSVDVERVYLPIQPNELNDFNAQTAKGTPNLSRYRFRKQVASLENVYRPVVDDLTGIMQKNDLNVTFGELSDDESPIEVQRIANYGNSDDKSLQGLKRRLNFNQVKYGRYGILLDVAVGFDNVPAFNIVEYSPWAILDGDYHTSKYTGTKRLKWALLDESYYRYDPATKSRVEWQKLRVVGVDGDEFYYQAVLEGPDAATKWGEFNFNAPQNAVYPTFKGERLRIVPFVVCNYDSIGLDIWNPPPYIDVANIAVDAYVVDSWLKMALYNCATPTLVTVNVGRNPDLRLGEYLDFHQDAGASDSSAVVKLLETTGAGISEMRATKTDLINSLKNSSIRDLLNGAGANSSAEALKLRVSPGTSIIASVDECGAAAIEEVCRYAAVWAGATEEEAIKRVSVAANTDYFPTDLMLQSVAQLIEINNASSAPFLSTQNAYALMTKAVPGTLSSYEDNLNQIEADVKEGRLKPKEETQPANEENNAESDDEKPIFEDEQ